MPYTQPNFSILAERNRRYYGSWTAVEISHFAQNPAEKRVVSATYDQHRDAIRLICEWPTGTGWRMLTALVAVGSKGERWFRFKEEDLSLLVGKILLQYEGAAAGSSHGSANESDSDVYRYEHRFVFADGEEELVFVITEVESSEGYDSGKNEEYQYYSQIQSSVFTMETHDGPVGPQLEWGAGLDLRRIVRTGIGLEEAIRKVTKNLRACERNFVEEAATLQSIKDDLSRSKRERTKGLVFPTELKPSK